MFLHRYSRWDGSQQVFEAWQEEVMDALSNDLLAHGDLSRALRDLLQRGMRNRQGERIPGLRDLMERLRSVRQQQLTRYDLDSVVEELRQRLRKAVETERQGIQRRLEQAQGQVQQETSKEERAGKEQLLRILQDRAAKSLQKLDQLPPSLAGSVSELQEYEFMDPEAQRQFQELLEMLKQRMLSNYMQEMRQRLQDMSPEEKAALRDMLRDLNQMLRDRMQSGEPDFQGFMNRYGGFFGANPPSSLDELVERLQHQIGQMQSLFESLSPEMRRELEELMNSVLDPETQAQLNELASRLERLYPLDDLRQQYPFLGEEPLTLEQAMEAMKHLQSLDELEHQLQEIGRQGNIEGLDPTKMEELLGEEARHSLEQLQRLARLLEDAGYASRRGDKLELTPKGMRKIGQRALRDIFANLKRDRTGGHEIHQKGSQGENTGDTKVYEYGDPFQIHLMRTLMNALVRDGSQPPIKLTPQDLEVYNVEELTQASTVLLLDQSRSMGLYGSFVAAKKVALALYTLVQSFFPRDSFYVVGFSDYAVEMKGDAIARVNWNSWVSGTNLHHALMLSRKLLSKHKGDTRQIIVITDGEPTAHLEGGRSYFSYPPSQKTVQETLREVKRCTQEGIIINTFMLETSPDLMGFVDKMTQLNRGRAFYTTPHRLGEYILVDYLRNRRKRLS